MSPPAAESTQEFGALVLAATMNMRQVLSILTSYIKQLGTAHSNVNTHHLTQSSAVGGGA